MLPVPTVAARAVHSAEKLEISPFPLFSALKINLNAVGSLVICKNPSLKVNKIPVPTNNTSNGGPHINESTEFKTSIKFIKNTPHIIV
ncbi:hypothetical protein SDC9_136937 [bioreactor metagenome]|uniref:Uncharacterized protein n=1 Tax=bioreactor metagenome TaxID=1076179 RepID=A0A645DMR0_9ZZZZ